MADYNDIWCVAETRQGKIVPGVYELFTGAKALASALGGKVRAVVIAKDAAALAAGFGAYGVEKAYAVDNPAFENFVDEAHGRALAELIAAKKPRLVLLPATTFGRSLSARAAGLAGIGLASEIMELSAAGDAIKAVRGCAGGGSLVEITWAAGKPAMASVRAGSFERAQAGNGASCAVETVAMDPASWGLKTRFKSFTPEETKEIDLARADIIVSGGYALGGPQAFEMLRQLAHLLGGAVGASRRAVDSGWIPYRHQVGLTGRTVKPKLYIACGISGQIQHLAGMSQSGAIVAINKDAKAPLMEMADFAVEGDIFEIIPALVEELKKAKQ